MSGTPGDRPGQPGRSVSGSRWRTKSVEMRGAADRVRISHAQARTSLGFALAFIGAAAIAVVAGGGSWLGLHLFLAGGVVLAISGVSVMLAVTWSAAPAAPGWAATTQRVCVIVGAAGVAVGRQLDLGAAVLVPAGVVYVGGLVLLAVMLVRTVRLGVERRFDAAVAAYVAALAAGTGGVVIGVLMATGTPSPALRGAHATLNLLGLVGLVIGATLPYFAATVGRSRMAPHATAPRLAAAAGWQVAALATAVAGLLGGLGAVAAAGFAAYAAGIGVLMWLMPRPNRRGLRWAGPRIVALWAGALWWAVAVAATAVRAASGAAVPDGRWLMVLVVAGYAQILWGSLAYLIPMLRGGGHERLSQGFAATRSWVALGAANVAGAAFAVGVPVVAAVAVGVWVVDTGIRACFGGIDGRSAPAEDSA